MRRASTPNPNQGYSRRRTSGGYGGHRGSKSEMGNIWEVVSALANALQDARNQLVNLMHTSKCDPMRLSPMRPMRLSGGRSGDSYECCYSRCVTPSRGYSPFAPRNLHRAHAHGHVAFGSNSEYPVHATPRRVRPREIHAEMSAQQASVPEGRRCTHPLHRIGVETRNLTPRRVQPKWPSDVVKGCRNLAHTEEQLGRKQKACVNFSSSENQGSRNGSRNASPEQRRHACRAKQFASLLTLETHQQQERRLAELALRGFLPASNRS